MSNSRHDTRNRIRTTTVRLRISNKRSSREEAAQVVHTIADIRASCLLHFLPKDPLPPLPLPLHKQPLQPLPHSFLPPLYRHSHWLATLSALPPVLMRSRRLLRFFLLLSLLSLQPLTIPLSIPFRSVWFSIPAGLVYVPASISLFPQWED